MQLMSKLKVTKKQAEKYFRRYLAMGPLGLALWRSTEARHFATVPLKRPIIDLGCGFGEFAQSFVDGEPWEMGIDISASDLAVCAKGKKYKNLAVADAADLPFLDNSYQTVLSISSLEHFDLVDKSIKEAYRVLKPRGMLAVTMETDRVDTTTVYRPFLKKIGLGSLSDFLSRSYNKLFHRVHLVSKKEWEKKITKAGFIIERSEDIISPTITKLYDAFLITAWPAQLPRLLFGKRIVIRPKFVSDILVKIFLKYIVRDEKDGTNLLIVATKPRVSKKR